MCGMTVSQTRNAGVPDAFNLAVTAGTTQAAAGVDATCTVEGIGKSKARLEPFNIGTLTKQD